jgi:penicillin amidase
VADFERLQQDVTSVPARRFQAAIGNWRPREVRLSRAVEEIAKWDGAMTTASIAASIYTVWIGKLPAAVFGRELGARTDLGMLLKTLESKPDPVALERSLGQALTELEKRLGPDIQGWQWGKLHQVVFRHPLNQKQFDRGPKSRPGDGNTVNSTGMGSGGFLQTTGASYRQILDLSDWDNSVMTNVPGESGDPASPHYSDLIDEWAAGKYHPMPFSRKAVQAAAREKILLIPKASTAKAKPATASTK